MNNFKAGGMILLGLVIFGTMIYMVTEIQKANEMALKNAEQKFKIQERLTAELQQQLNRKNLVVTKAQLS